MESNKRDTTGRMFLIRRKSALVLYFTKYTLIYINIISCSCKPDLQPSSLIEEWVDSY